MTAARNLPQQKRLYQPPLPWKADPGLGAPTTSVRSTAPANPKLPTKGRRSTADSRQATRQTSRPAPGQTNRQASGPALPARRAVSYGDWRLDEKTRRAGRQGVALARAALAGASSPAERRHANAA